MSDLIAFLRARLDDDEREAKARRGIFPSPGVHDDGYVWLHIRPGGNAVITRYPYPVEGYDDMAKLRNWADTERGWTQERVLAEVEAKRQIIDQHERYTAEHRRMMGGWDPQSDDSPILAALAAVYAYHPDHKEEW